MLKEARIVMPYYGIDESIRAHTQLQDKLERCFGGFTACNGEGRWYADGRTHRDSVTIYDVAMDDFDGVANTKLAEIAIDAGRLLYQQAVYVRYADGKVSIIDIKPEIDETAHVRQATAGLGDRLANPSETDKLYTELTGKPFQKRLPATGEIWRNRANALVAVMTQATVLDGGFNVVPITKGDWSRAPGACYVINLDGQVHGGSYGATRPGDLVQFVTRFDS